MSAVQGIICDGCGKWRATATKTQPAAGPTRERAKADGWRTTRGEYQSVTGPRGYTRDLCPTCWVKGVR